ncbi:hypothetical protein EIP86_010777 [Pleurotus ostreatoroseus]|nr:hypothetical protein EIP86_010777 [Pleurotus ostreatoroseus]
MPFMRTETRLMEETLCLAVSPSSSVRLIIGSIGIIPDVFLIASISIYVALASEFVLRFLTNRPVRKVTGATSDAPRYLDRKVKLMLVGLGFSSITLFIRCVSDREAFEHKCTDDSVRSVYRTIELADGWTGRVISTQVYFNVLDGAMIVLASFTLNFFHPGLLLGRGDTWNRKHYEPETKSLDTMTETPARSGEGEKDVKSPA